MVIALEPECASLYCQSLSEEKLIGSSDLKKVGSKYLVIDSGGELSLMSCFFSLFSKFKLI